MKHKYLNIIPECYVDTNLIEYLVGAGVNHQHSCTKVVGLLNNQFKDKFAIGIIDLDKVQLGYIRECRKIASTEHLCLMKHITRKQYLITVSPAADGFILDCATTEDIGPNDYGLPSQLKDFTKVSKSVTSNKDMRFRNLFKALRNNNEFRALGASLKYLIENEYKALDEVLIGLFTTADK